MEWYAQRMMTPPVPNVIRTAAVACRNVAVALLSGWLTGWSFDDLEHRLAGRSVTEQAAVTGGVLAALFLLALLAAQAGVVGLCVYGLAVVIIAR
jgi:hypothetical protein